MKLKSIKTFSDQIIELNKISVLVGANNVGKSQTLRDIKERMEIGKASKPVILKEINFEKPQSLAELFIGFELQDSSHNLDYKIAVGIKNSLVELERFEFNYKHFENEFVQKEDIDFILGNISKFRVSFLDASSRLNLVRTVSSFNPSEEKPQNILQSLFVQAENESQLKRAFIQAFGMDIMLDYNGMKDFCLRIASVFPNIPPDPREAYLITRNFNKIDNQGDGFRSFVGIILSILFSKNRIVLLDEPEAFLHPAQARFLGKWIADNSSKLESQLIIATHNANFLNGILSSENKVDVFRLNRTENDTIYNLIPPEATEKLSKSPMLSSQRILEAIFHKGVIVCEADADRAVYQSVASLVFNNQEILFVHSHNKQTLKDVAKLLIDAKIPVIVIPDIDILNDEKDFQLLIEILTQKSIKQETLEKRAFVAQKINELPDDGIMNNLQELLNEFLGQLKSGEHKLDGAKGALNRIRSEITKWKSPKENGIEGFPEDCRKQVCELLEECKLYNIHIPQVGELEGWIEVGTKRKNKWIIKALEEIHQGNSPAALNIFVKEMIEKLRISIA